MNRFTQKKIQWMFRDVLSSIVNENDKLRLTQLLDDIEEGLYDRTERLLILVLLINFVILLIVLVLLLNTQICYS